MTKVNGDEETTRIVMGSQEKLRLVVQLIILFFFCLGTYYAFGYRDLARYFPVFAGSLGITASVIAIILDQLRYRKGIPAPRASLGEATLFSAPDPSTIKSWLDWPLVRAARYILWFVGFGAALYFLDIIVVGPVFVFVFYLTEVDMVWWKSLIFGFAAFVLVWLLSTQLGLTTP